MDFILVKRTDRDSQTKNLSDEDVYSEIKKRLLSNMQSPLQERTHFESDTGESVEYN